MSASDGTTADIGTDLVDVDALARWMDAQGLPGDTITGAEALSGGTQNLLMRFTRGGRDYVLRRGPRHLRRASNEAMRREARVLQALGNDTRSVPPDDQLASGHGRAGQPRWPAHPRRDRRPLRPALRPRHRRHRLVHGPGLFQARHRPRGHPRPRLRGQGAKPTGDLLHAITLGLFARARTVIAKG